MTRQCGDCQLCCKLVPVKELDKPAGERCRYQRVGKGCTVYDRRPGNCRLWSCRWLIGEDTGELRRPDRAHYVIDCMLEFIKVHDHETKQTHSVPCIQVWIDPRHPEAHRDPALRAYLGRRGTEGCVGLIRFGAYDGLVLIPPSMTSDGLWHEQRGTSEGREHSADEVAQALAAHGLSPLGGLQVTAEEMRHGR